MNKNLNQIDELFKSRLEGVEAAPSSTVKALVVKEVSALILKNIILSAVLIASVVTAITASGILAYKSYEKENERLAQIQLENLSSSLAIDAQKENSIELSLLFLGQGVKNSAQTTNHASLLPNKKTKVKPILETDGEFELANDVSPSHSAHAAGVKKGSKTIFHATPASLSNDVKYADFSNSHTDNDELITAAAYEPLDSNGALSSDVLFKHQIIENHIDSSKGDAGSSSGLHKNSLENQNLAMSEKSLITNNGENTNLELAEYAANKVKLLDPNSFIYPTMSFGTAARNLPNAKKLRPLAGPWSLGITSSYSRLKSNSTAKDPEFNETKFQSVSNTASALSFGLRIDKKIGAVRIGSGIETLTLTSHARINANTTETISYTEIIETLQSVTLDGEIVLDENGEEVTELVSSEVTFTELVHKTNTTEVTNKFKYLSIPFYLSYDLHSSRLNTLNLSSSFTWNRLLNSSGVLPSEDGLSLIELTSNSELINKNLFNLNLGFEVKRKLSKRLDFSLSPNYSFNLNNINKLNGISNSYYSGAYMRVSLFSTL